ncbi:MAG: response regulator [Candidatus Omnitrophica bacterium]|nr:response regulator [Candidatus Omnitrophota bacterium]
MESQKRILIVEDDEPLAHLMKMKLESDGGFAVHVETRGNSALSYAAGHPLDLVILDLKLPDVSGYDVAKHLRKLYHPWVLPVLMLTGLDKPIDQLRGFAFGADAYLTKPYEPDELMKTIQLLCGEGTRA